MVDTPKNGGAASQVCQGKEGASAEIELSRKNKNVSPFCDNCRPGDIQYASIREFTDRRGDIWHCFKPFTCEHAIILGGAIASCRVRTAQLNLAEQEREFI
jgi:hypothetical protein